MNELIKQLINNADMIFKIGSWAFEELTKTDSPSEKDIKSRRERGKSLSEEGVRLGLLLSMPANPTESDLQKAASKITEQRRNIGSNLKNEARLIKCNIKISDIPGDQEISAARGVIQERRRVLKRKRRIAVFVLLIVSAALYLLSKNHFK